MYASAHLRRAPLLVCPICGRDLLLSFIVIYFDFLLFVYWGCCSVVRQVTLPEHYGGKVFRYLRVHRHALSRPGSNWRSRSVHLLGAGHSWGRLAVYQVRRPCQRLRGGLGPSGLTRCPLYGPPHPHQPSSHCALAGRPGQPLVVLVAVHMFFRLRREGILSPTNIMVFVFYAGSPELERALF
jgi:hypothetical protein